MLLAVDVGNTQTHLGAFEGERLVQHWRFQTRSGATGDELAERIAGLAPGDLNRIFFTTGGSEAVESAWKL
ncbi:MAG TPA: type III pantothenate kinase, partial [Solirubrobacterales bacterium]